MTKTTVPRPVSFAALIQQFFTEYLVTQRALSPRTIASYRDAMLLFLDFARHRLDKMPTALNLDDITPDLILTFLDHLEQQRQNSVRSRNLRLTALRAFLKFAARHDVTSFFVIEQALGVPMKRFERPMLGFMSREEMLAVIGQPGDTWTSQRDHLLFAMLYNTGGRVSEIIGIKVVDVVLGESACVHLRGKGRKQRSTPLWKGTVQEIGVWLRRTQHWEQTPRCCLTGMVPMTRCNVTQRLNIAVARAAQVYSSLSKRKISPNIIRHTTAMHLLQSGVAFSVIALWLGHESTITTHRYVETDLAMKEKALARLQEPETILSRYQPADDELMQFLKDL
jgi:site-specific recombinase XerD